MVASTNDSMGMETNSQLSAVTLLSKLALVAIDAPPSGVVARFSLGARSAASFGATAGIENIVHATIHVTERTLSIMNCSDGEVRYEMSLADMERVDALEDMVIVRSAADSVVLGMRGDHIKAAAAKLVIETRCESLGVDMGKKGTQDTTREGSGPGHPMNNKTEVSVSSSQQHLSTNHQQGKTNFDAALSILDRICSEDGPPMEGTYEDASYQSMNASASGQFGSSLTPSTSTSKFNSLGPVSEMYSEYPSFNDASSLKRHPRHQLESFLDTTSQKAGNSRIYKFGLTPDEKRQLRRRDETMLELELVRKQADDLGDQLADANKQRQLAEQKLAESTANMQHQQQRVTNSQLVSNSFTTLTTQQKAMLDFDAVLTPTINLQSTPAAVTGRRRTGTILRRAQMGASSSSPPATVAEKSPEPKPQLSVKFDMPTTDPTPETKPHATHSSSAAPKVDVPPKPTTTQPPPAAPTKHVDVPPPKPTTPPVAPPQPPVVVSQQPPQPPVEGQPAPPPRKAPPPPPKAAQPPPPATAPPTASGLPSPPTGLPPPPPGLPPPPAGLPPPPPSKAPPPPPPR